MNIYLKGWKLDLKRLEQVGQYINAELERKESVIDYITNHKEEAFKKAREKFLISMVEHRKWMNDYEIYCFNERKTIELIKYLKDERKKVMKRINLYRKKIKEYEEN